jgi:hypothetical protein
MALLSVMLPLFAIAPASAQAAAPAGARTLRDLGYGDLTARTMYGTLDYFVPIPRGLAPQAGSQIDLVVSHSPLLVPERSTVTVVANGQSVGSAFLTRENAVRGKLSVPLPVDNFTGGGYFVQVQFSMRLTRDECEETGNPALWATVHGDSGVSVPTAPRSAAPTLDESGGLFTPPAPIASPTAASADPPPETAAVVLPRGPASEEVEAAGLVAYQLGRWAAAAGRDPVVGAARAPVPGRANVVVGQGGSLAQAGSWGTLGWSGQAFSTPGGQVPAEHGVLAVRADAGSPRLLVSGGSPSGVRLAAESVVRPQSRALLGRDYAVATGALAIPAPARPWENGAASFAQLGADRRVVNGPGEHTMDLFFDRPPEWTLRPGTFLELALDAAPGLRFETSWVAASVNGIDVGTRRLEATTGDETRVRRIRFELPADALSTSLDGRPQRALALQLRLFLDLPQSGCTQAAPTSAWATVLPTSSWQLPHEDYGGLDLGRFPAPFVLATGDTSAIVALPDQPTDAELSAGLQVMAALGRWATGEPTALPRLVLGAAVDPANANVILVGRPDRNGLSQAAAAKAPALFEEIDPVVYRLAPGERRGYLRLAESPWTKGRVALALIGDGTTGATLAAQALTRADVRSGLRGRLAVVQDGLPAQVLQNADPPAAAPEFFAPRLAQAQPRLIERLPAWQLVGGVVLVAFVAFLAIVFSVRWRRKLRG